MVIARLVDFIINIYIIGLVIYTLLSWTRSPASFSLRTRMAPWFEPLLEPVRRLLGKINLGSLQIDISPVILIILLSILGNIIVRLLIPPI